MPYEAFISYSHAADGRLAPELQSALHRFAKPWYRLRAIHVFRDKTSLSTTPALWPAIEQALSQSKYFILLASPEAAASHWVNQEIAYWLGNRSADKFLIAVTEGELNWDTAVNDFNWNTTTALPQTLRNVFKDEPLYLDLRWAKTEEDLSLHNPKFRESVAELAAPLHGRPKDEIVGEDVRQHKRTKRLTWSAIIALLALTLSSVIAAYIAVQQKNSAERQAQIALARQLAAQAELVLNQQPSQLERSVLIAAESMRRFHLLGIRSLEADQILRRGLALLPSVEANITFDEDSATGRSVTAFSPDGHYFAAAHGEELRLWNTDNGEAIGSMQHTGSVKSVLFSADNRYLVTTTGTADPNSKADTAWVWEMASRKNIFTKQLFTKQHSGAIWSIAISPHGKYVTIGEVDKIVNVWDTVSGQQLASMTYGGEIWSAVFSPDGKYLAIGSREYGKTSDSSAVSGLLQVWSASDWQTVFERKQDSPVTMIRFTPDSRYLAAISGSTASVWEVSSGKIKTSVAHQSSISSLEFSAHGKYLGTGSWDGTARIWNLSNGQEVKRFFHNSAVAAVAFTPDETGFVTAAIGEKIAQMWDIASGREIARAIHDDAINHVGFNHNGQRLLTTSKDGSTRILRIPSPSVSSLMYGWQVQVVTFSPDGRYLAIADWVYRDNKRPKEETIHLWDVKSGRELLTIARESTENPAIGRSSTNGIAISGNKKFLAATGGWGYSHVANVWDLSDGQLIFTATHKFGVQSVALSTDASYLATVSAGVMRLWERSTGQQTNELPADRGLSSIIAFSPDGRLLAYAGDSGQVNDATEIAMLQVSNGREIARIRPDYRVNAIAFSPDTKYLATAGANGVAQIWKISSLQPIARLIHDANVTAVAFSPDGKFLATASENGIARVWSAATHSEVARVRHEGYLPAVAFSPDGKYLITANGYKTQGPGEYAANRYNSARLWLWQPEDLVAEACDRVTRNLTSNEWHQFTDIEEVPVTCAERVTK